MAPGEIWFAFNVSASDATQKLPRQPKEVWYDEGCRTDGEQLHLEAGATWVGEVEPT